GGAGPGGGLPRPAPDRLLTRSGVSCDTRQGRTRGGIMTDQVPHPPGPMRRPPSSRTVGTIFLAIGIALLVILGSIAAVLWVRQAERSDWPHADGTVVEVSTHVDRDSSRRSRHDRSGTTMYTPVVEFRVDGETHRFTSGVSTSDPWTV